MVTAIIRLVDIIPAQNILGECSSWHAQSGQLWWTDIAGRQIYRYTLGTQALDHFETPRRLCSFAFTDCPDQLIAAFENGIALYHPADQHCDWIYRLEDDHAPVRFNDGRTDRQGRFWAGTMMEGPFDTLRPLGEIYCFDRNGIVFRHNEPVKITNSLCTSPDGRKLYFSDSPRHTIFVCSLDEGGQLHNQRIFARTPAGCQPDGATTDVEGCLWSAYWGGGCLMRYAPDGHTTQAVTLPVSQPTSVAFGGKNMNLIFVTTAKDGLTDTELVHQPQAGDMFIYETDVIGLADAQFA